MIARSYPNLRITVDKDLNAISVYASAAEQQRIADAITQLDASPSQSNGTNGAGPAYGDNNIDPTTV